MERMSRIGYDGADKNGNNAELVLEVTVVIMRLGNRWESLDRNVISCIWSRFENMNLFYYLTNHFEFESRR